MTTPTPVFPLTRVVLWADVAVTVIAGIALYPLARQADTDFAWTIKAPITAAFLGAGYWGAMVGIALAAMTRDWQRVRAVFVVGVVLTSLMLLPTLIYIDQFHLDEGTGAAKRLAWFWLILYLVQPLVVAAVFVWQERAGGRYEYGVEQPVLPWLKLVLGIHAVGLTAVALALWPIRADGFWPWPLPDLAAGAIAVWLVTFAAAAGWCLREGDWRRCRVIFPAYLTMLVLLIFAALRFSEAFDGGAWQTWTWLAAIAVSFLLLSAGALQQELRRRPAALSGSRARA
jgi:hypothetical protein